MIYYLLQNPSMKWKDVGDLTWREALYVLHVPDSVKKQYEDLKDKTDNATSGTTPHRTDLDDEVETSDGHVTTHKERTGTNMEALRKLMEEGNRSKTMFGKVRDSS